MLTLNSSTESVTGIAKSGDDALRTYFFEAPDEQVVTGKKKNKIPIKPSSTSESPNPNPQSKP
jgi:hypothetical protein